MDLIKERQLNYEMLRHLVEERRAITEMMLDIKQTIKRLDGEIERYQETLSAKEYINIRNAMKRELEESMREQLEAEIRQELLLESASNSEVAATELEPSIIPSEVIEEAKSKEFQEGIKLDISFATIRSLTIAYLKERGVPVATADLKRHLEENRNHTWTMKSFNQLVWRMKREPDDGKLSSPTRGFIQYNA